MSDQADVTGRDTYLLVEALTFTVEALSGLPNRASARQQYCRYETTG